MDRYRNLFNRLEAKNEGAFVPFVMLGDPDKSVSESIINQLIDSGADALELGIPYSDPIADGPTIQRASIRALKSRITPTDCFDIIRNIRAQHPDVPIGLLLYSNLVLKRGIDTFYDDAAQAGVDSILIADVPLREAQRFIDTAQQHSIQQILIAPPNASDETLKTIGEKSSGYTYLLGRAGVTGAETAAAVPAKALIDKLTQYDVAPPLLGFGISTPQQVNDAINAGAAGAISGSATVNIIAEHVDDEPKMLAALDKFVRDMKAATAKAPRTGI
ncbi:tryptophan synthase subunit alpha [Alteromonas oceanisediminis]|uniref:tryptophan synthase subunit alpha n=1 Tax=Alteromonas oceanisediminis TaxID=2836180 RepID=UPI001BD970DA|nr:tryptophan synthase subunit alpha [Alteromonas oceanisediminis]MBT0588055.1 tryptophan synthase subunit alpha [Alteromonas oceanisediminis]